MPPQPKKAPTKGAKQVVVENEATINFYRNMAGAVALLYSAIMFGFYNDQITSGLVFLNVMVMIVYVGCYQMMRYMSQALYTDEGVLVDAGLDLNMEGGIGEHIKDIVILTSITHALAIISNYFWLLLLFIPVRGFWLVWKNFLGPWFFQEAPQDAEMDEKKRKKMERRMRRHQ
ncbi:transmembrane protein 208 isoform X2 [Leptidea sinapis]|uniref:Transmembrane protein 208 n=1 Tax=Leptidea sinapis TaxID=189913 RepID=A0A5E4QX69_9NEOP|nr:transmembrane protein 208 isoform X2 [Leptidea sinapis]VVD02789.1 unnamed protein product [Leptidea sinapis]